MISLSGEEQHEHNFHNFNFHLKKSIANGTLFVPNLKTNKDIMKLRYYTQIFLKE